MRYTVHYMAKVGALPRSFRLKNEVIWALEELAAQWECSQTQAVERAILRAHNGASEPIAAPKPTSSAPATKAEITIFCRHCGQPFAGQKFQPPLCVQCAKDGHGGDPRNCRICQDGGTGAL